MSAQIIEKDGMPEYAIIPYDEYIQLRETAEMAEDVHLFDEAMATPSEVFPSSLIDRLLSDENPIRVWRKYRGLSLTQLAEACGVSIAYISQIENGVRDGARLLQKMIEVLNVSMDQLVKNPD